MAKESTERLIMNARDIADEYDGNLTLRQLYYQLVARGFIPNSQESYKRLVGRLTDARLNGEFPIDALLDRTREARPGAFLRCQTDAHDAAANIAAELRNGPEQWLHADRWFDSASMFRSGSRRRRWRACSRIPAKMLAWHGSCCAAIRRFRRSMST